jgi:hypothetical protein
MATTSHTLYPTVADTLAKLTNLEGKAQSERFDAGAGYNYH